MTVLNEEGVKCSYHSVRDSVKEVATYRRRIKRVALNEGFAKRRFSFADSHLCWTQPQWDKLLNTDSSPFYLRFKYNRQNDGAWVGEGQDPPSHDINKYSIKTEVYMGVCARG